VGTNRRKAGTALPVRVSGRHVPYTSNLRIQDDERAGEKQNTRSISVIAERRLFEVYPLLPRRTVEYGEDVMD
jgi:hypothetical protein